MTPRVTVLMAVYNSPVRMLEQAIASILAQSYRDFELLLLDDGSTDTDLREYLSRRALTDRRIRLADEPHRGLTPTLNRGLALAQGPYIARHDADDWSEPERLELQVSYLDAHPDVHLCGSAIWTHQDDGARLWPVKMPATHADILNAFLRGNPFVHGAAMFRRETALAIGGYCEQFRCAQDYDFFWRMSEHAGAVNLPQHLYHYRYTSGSVSAQKAIAQMEAHRAIQRLAQARQRGESADPAQALDAVTAEMAKGTGLFRALLKQADHLMLAGDYQAALRGYASLLKVHPLSPLAWGKLARLGVFRTFPSMREDCFR